MSLEYNYDDPDRKWPCIGWLNQEELAAEWLRCYKMIQSDGDVVVVRNYMLSDRLRTIEQESLVWEFIRENDFRWKQGDFSVFGPNGAGFEVWRFMKFMGREVRS